MKINITHYDALLKEELIQRKNISWMATATATTITTTITTTTATTKQTASTLFLSYQSFLSQIVAKVNVRLFNDILGLDTHCLGELDFVSMPLMLIKI